MVDRAQDYPWSSYSLRQNENAEHVWIDKSPGFEALGLTHSDRLARYSEFMEQATPASELQLIRHKTKGTDLFKSSPSPHCYTYLTVTRT
jgi:putative transposase